MRQGRYGQKDFPVELQELLFNAFNGRYILFVSLPVLETGRVDYEFGVVFNSIFPESATIRMGENIFQVLTKEFESDILIGDKCFSYMYHGLEDEKAKAIAKLEKEWSIAILLYVYMLEKSEEYQLKAHLNQSFSREASQRIFRDIMSGIEKELDLLSKVN